MELKEAVELVASKFKYQRDKESWSDSWKVMRENEGVYYGDCEDFALTVFWYLADKNLVKFVWNLMFTHQYKLIWCKAMTGELHFYGQYGDMCFDNWTKKALPEQEFLNQTGHKRKMQMFIPFCLVQLTKGFFKR